MKSKANQLSRVRGVVDRTIIVSRISEVCEVARCQKRSEVRVAGWETRGVYIELAPEMYSSGPGEIGLHGVAAAEVAFDTKVELITFGDPQFRI